MKRAELLRNLHTIRLTAKQTSICEKRKQSTPLTEREHLSLALCRLE